MYDWDENYTINIKKMDKQHRKWLSIIKLLFQAIQEGRNKATITNIISDLHNYTHFHFASEEQYIKRYKYTAYELHKKKHREFLNKLHDFEYNYKIENIQQPVAAMNSLKDWLINHIQKEDMNYSHYIHKNSLK